MRTGTPGFIPARLTEARQARRIPSKSALARRLGMSPASVSGWEDEGSDQTPDHATLMRLAGELHVRPEYFLRPSFRSERPTFLRSLSTTLVRDLSYQKAQMQWLQEVSFALGHYVDFPEVDIPDVLAGTCYNQLRDEDIEEIALTLRRHWKLGDGPCGDVVSLMERIGIVVATIPMNTTNSMGFAVGPPLMAVPMFCSPQTRCRFPVVRWTRRMNLLMLFCIRRSRRRSLKRICALSSNKPSVLRVQFCSLRRPIRRR